MERTFDAASVDTFTALTGDSNPIHVSSADGGGSDGGTGGGNRPSGSRERNQGSGVGLRSSTTDDGRPAAIVPGMLLASLFPAIIGSTFPGALYATQTLAFRSSCLVDEPVTATVAVTRASGRRVVFDTSVRASADGRVLVDGSALAMIGGLGPASGGE